MINVTEALEKEYYSNVIKVFALSIVGIITIIGSSYMMYRLYTTASEDNFLTGAFLIGGITLAFGWFIKLQMNKVRKNMKVIAAKLKLLGRDVPEL